MLIERSSMFMERMPFDQASGTCIKGAPPRKGAPFIRQSRID